ncbi:hypothetical protein B0H11DRAFT_1925815 [Mycena galericulata]|nr:hypothetical protein B0H11DRAFT_1925815 [Mycena galericulata]
MAYLSSKFLEVTLQDEVFHFSSSHNVSIPSLKINSPRIQANDPQGPDYIDRDQEYRAAGLLIAKSHVTNYHLLSTLPRISPSGSTYCARARRPWIQVRKPAHLYIGGHIGNHVTLANLPASRTDRKPVLTSGSSFRSRIPLRSRSVSPEKSSAAVASSVVERVIRSATSTVATVSKARNSTSLVFPRTSNPSALSSLRRAESLATATANRNPSFATRGRSTRPEYIPATASTAGKRASLKPTKIILDKSISPVPVPDTVSAEGEIQQGLISPLASQIPSARRSMDFSALQKESSIEGREPPRCGMEQGYAMSEMATLQREYLSESETHDSTFEGVKWMVSKTELLPNDVRD